MKRLLLIVLLHLSLFFLVFAYQAQAEEEGWSVEVFSDFVVTAKHGEVIHGDKLRFFIKKNDCSRMGILFTFSTMKNNQNLNNLQNQTCTFANTSTTTICITMILLVRCVILTEQDLLKILVFLSKPIIQRLTVANIVVYLICIITIHRYNIQLQLMDIKLIMQD